MDVGNLLTELISVSDVAVVAATALPETRGTLTIRDAREDRCVERSPPDKNTLGEPGFQAPENGRNRLFTAPKNEMYMLGHNHPSKEIETYPFSCIDNCFCEVNLDQVILEERKPAVGAESDEPYTSIFEPTQSLPILRHDA